MAAAATALPSHQPPFLVGRPTPDRPLSTSTMSDCRRAMTTLGLGASAVSPGAVLDAARHTPAVSATPRSRQRGGKSPPAGGYPRVVVRDPTGRTLDTFTTLQDAIYRASWTLKTLHEWPSTSQEWRLPKAPVPSRPDFSRAGAQAVMSYSLDLTKSYRTSADSTPTDSKPVVEIDVEDVSFVAESLRLLPQLPSFAFLRHSLLAGQRTYLSIVGSVLLHQRQLAATDKRDADYTFPGFCYGCKRAGFCYGCDKNPRPHVHEDIPMRTGGGFLFYRRDLPLNQHAHRDPRNWSTGDSDVDLRNIIERCGGLAAYERAAMTSQKLMTGKDGQAHPPLPILPKFSRVRLLCGPWSNQKNLFTIMDSAKEVEEEEIQEAGDTVDMDTGGRPVTIATDRPYRKSVLKKDPSVYSESGDEDGVRSRLRRSVTIDTGDALLGVSSDDEGDVGGRNTSEYDSGFETGSGHPRRSRKMGAASSRASGVSRPSTLSTRSRSESRSRSKSSGGGVAFGGSLRSRDADATGRRISKEETPEERKARLENIPFAKKRDETLYQAPTFFQPKQKTRRKTVAKDPFSTDREYDLPQGGQFQLKKNEQKATKFVSIKRTVDYKPPKHFELKHEERKATKFWSPKVSNKEDNSGKGKGRRGDDSDDDEEARRRRKRMQEKSNAEKETKPAPVIDTSGGDGGDDNDDDETAGLADQISEPVVEVEKPKRKEVVRKVRRVISPPGVKRRERTPSPPPPPRQPTPPPPIPTPPPPSPPEEPPLPEFALPEMPDLPEWQEKDKEEKQKKQKFMVAPPPQPAEGPKRRKAAPKVRRQLKVPIKRLKTKPAEAPVANEQVQDMQDPLDWLAKYCIINPDRLPLYEMVFESVIAEQTPRYVKPEPPSLKDILKVTREGAEEGGGGGEENDEGAKGKKKKQKGKKQKDKAEEKPEKMSQLTLLHRSLLDQPKVGLSLPEQQLEKLCYTLDTLHYKFQELSTDLQTLDDKRTKQLADKARELFPEVVSPDYAPKGKKKGKKKLKTTAPAIKLRPQDITDDIIVSRMDDKMLNSCLREPEVHQTELELGRAREKIHDVTQRLQELASEKLLTDAFCMNHYFAQQGLNSKPAVFRRQQSELYNRLNPEPNMEMNLEEVEDALQQINGHLLTQKEFFFLYNVLNLPARTSINFRLFSVVAALSEKVTQLDPVIRKLINNTDYNALDIKMEKCRELFQFLEDEEIGPRGGATAEKLAVELTAGGLTPEHTRFVLSKFNREKRGIVDFLDFVTYVPLFILIHRRIILHPLRAELDL